MNFKPNMLFLNRSFDKKRLKALLLWFRLNLSENAALKAVEILQGLGFRSATQGAISLGLDDLKTPTSKGGRVFQAQVEVALAHHEHHRGNRTPVELFQHLVDTWHRTSQDLTTEVVQLFHSTERVNPVYMMAFSGARGNISQVRQLVGMRGLMADPRGQIVGFPILSNFREGLTITEYFVSCYGARKGVVDTAIRTADAGYLTRRLADVSHHVVVRTTNCGTHESILLRDIKEGQKTILSLANRLVGRVLAEHIFLPTSPGSDSLIGFANIFDVNLDSQGKPNPNYIVSSSFADPISAKQKAELPTSTLASQGKPLLQRNTGALLVRSKSFPCEAKDSFASPEGSARQMLPLLLTSFGRRDQKMYKEVKAQRNLAKLNFVQSGKTIIYRNSEITSSLASKLAEHYSEIPVRSPLSCSLPWGVCQLCYGWGLSEGRRVTLGEAVGIIAAQSIGEPGTQLTLRTFHTGGVFSGELLNEIRSPYSGTVIFPTPLQGLLLRTPHGQIAFLTKVSGKMKISETEVHFASKIENLDISKSIDCVDNALHLKESLPYQARKSIGVEPGGTSTNGFVSLASCPKEGKEAEESVAEKLTAQIKGQKSKLFLPKQDSEFFIQPSTVIFVKQKEHVINNQLLAEFSSSTLQSVNDQIEITQQVLSETAGQIWFKEIEYGNRKGPGSGSLGTYFSSQKLGGIWVLAGKPTASSNPIIDTNYYNPLTNVRSSEDVSKAKKRYANPSKATDVQSSYPKKTLLRSSLTSSMLVQDVRSWINTANPSFAKPIPSLAPRACQVYCLDVWERASVRNWGVSNKPLKSFIPLVTIIRGKQRFSFGTLNGVPNGVSEARKINLLTASRNPSNGPLVTLPSVHMFRVSGKTTKTNISCKTTSLLHENKISFHKNCNTHLVFNNFVLSNFSKFPKINELPLKRKYLFKYHTYGIQHRLKRSINTRYAKTSTTPTINLQNNYDVLKYNYVLGYSQAINSKRHTLYIFSLQSKGHPKGVEADVRNKGNICFADPSGHPSEAKLSLASQGKDVTPPISFSSFVNVRSSEDVSETTKMNLLGGNKVVQGQLNNKEKIANHLVILTSSELCVRRKSEAKNNLSVAKKRVSIPLTTELGQSVQFFQRKHRLAGTPVYAFQLGFPNANYAAKPFDKSGALAACYTKSSNRFFEKTKIRLCGPSEAKRYLSFLRAELLFPSLTFSFARPKGKGAQKMLAKQRTCIRNAYGISKNLKNSTSVYPLQSTRLYSKEVKELCSSKSKFTIMQGKTRGSSKKLDMLPLLSEIDLVTFAYRAKLKGVGHKRDFLLKNSSFGVRENIISLPPLPVLPSLAPYFNKTSFSFLASLASFNASISSKSIDFVDASDLLTSSMLPLLLTSFGRRAQKMYKEDVQSSYSEGALLTSSMLVQDVNTNIEDVSKAKKGSSKRDLSTFFCSLPLYPFPPAKGLQSREVVELKSKVDSLVSLTSYPKEGISVDGFVSQGNKSSYFVTEKRRLQGTWIQKKRAYLTYLNQICSIPFTPQFTKGTKGYRAEAFTNFISRTNLQLSLFCVPQPTTFPSCFPLTSKMLAKQSVQLKGNSPLLRKIGFNREPFSAMPKAELRTANIEDVTPSCFADFVPEGITSASLTSLPSGTKSAKQILTKEKMLAKFEETHQMDVSLSEAKGVHVQPAIYFKGVKGRGLAEIRSKEGLAELKSICNCNQSETRLKNQKKALHSFLRVRSQRSKGNADPSGHPSEAKLSLASQGKDLLRTRKVKNTPITSSYIYPGQLVAYGDNIASNVVTTESGQVLYIDSQKTTVRKAQTVLIYSQAIIAVLSGDWIKKGTPLMSLSYQKLVTGDIVQGLPKIEQFFEAPVLRDGTFWSDSLQAKLNQFFQEEREKLPLAEAVRKSFSEIQRVLVEGVLRVYISQGVLIADKHLEVIVRQMTCKGRILYSGDTGFLRNELVSLDKIENVNQVTYGQKALYHPQVRGITDASLESESFLSAASFQETTRVLSRDAIIGKTDLMRGLKERVIVGELIQAGTGLANNSVYNLLTPSFE